MQDVILEPFGGDVLNAPMSATTRYNSYWQTATVITLVGGAAYLRKRPPEDQKGVAGWGLSIMALGMVLIAVESFLGGVRLIEIGLLTFGAGFGIYTFGGLSLMAVMSSDRDAGAYLGLWTISILIFKGLGNFLGSLLRDVFLGVGLPAASAYGIAFAVAAVGLAASVIVLRQIDVVGFAQDNGRYQPSMDDIQAAGVEL
ncbi:MAG: PucC family protein, partial [Chloroflexota bacterium]